MVLPGPKRQRAGAVQDAGAKGDGYREREAFWTAVPRHRFWEHVSSAAFMKPNRHMIFDAALKQSPRHFPATIEIFTCQRQKNWPSPMRRRPI
jgi:hypothetical protein